MVPFRETAWFALDSLLEGDGFDLSVEGKVASNLGIPLFLPLCLGTKLGTIPLS